MAPRVGVPERARLRVGWRWDELKHLLAKQSKRAVSLEGPPCGLSCRSIFIIMRWQYLRSRKKMLCKRKWSTLAAFGLALTSSEILAAEDLLLGFQLGDTMEQAKVHAKSNGWVLQALSDDLQRVWVIEGVDADLYVCKNRVLAVRREFLGGLDEFATLVQEVQFEQGVPETRVITFRSGSRRISNVDARFQADNGTTTLVQLSSIDGEVGVSTNVWFPDVCSVQNE